MWTLVCFCVLLFLHLSRIRNCCILNTRWASCIVKQLGKEEVGGEYMLIEISSKAYFHIQALTRYSQSSIIWHSNPIVIILASKQTLQRYKTCPGWVLLVLEAVRPIKDEDFSSCRAHHSPVHREWWVSKNCFALLRPPELGHVFHIAGWQEDFAAWMVKLKGH